MQEHLFAIYLPFCSEPLYERMIDGTLWRMIQASHYAVGLALTACVMKIWIGSRIITPQSKKDSE